jgi:alpha-L-fucosidase
MKTSFDLPPPSQAGWSAARPCSDRLSRQKIIVKPGRSARRLVPLSLLAALVLFSRSSRAALPPGAPEPSGPVPSFQQLAWQRDELLMFEHFGLHSFAINGDHMGTGQDDPKLFNPTALDCGQWVRVAKMAGFKGIILTAKHHDGFCNWPSASTEYSIRHTPWKNGKGDVVAELAAACRKGRIKFGLYLSAYDRNYAQSGRDKQDYPKVFAQQLTELLSNYGKVDEVWFDGFGSQNMVVDRAERDAICEKLQPDAVMFGTTRQNAAKTGKGLRWVGNEAGRAPETMWSVYPRPSVPDAFWYPTESDTILIGGWFWMGDQDKAKSLNELLDIYYQTVGHNSVLLLNVAADQRGLIPDAAIERLKEWRTVLDRTFKVNLARGGVAASSVSRGEAFAPENAIDGNWDSYWAAPDGVTNASIELSFPQPVTFDVVMLQEQIRLGQRVQAWHVDAFNSASGDWSSVAKGTTVGYKRLERVQPVTAFRVRFVIDQALACPVINELGLFKRP